MSNLDKSELFDKVSESLANKAEIQRNGNQSIQIILPCGCKQTQHHLVPVGSKANLKAEYVSLRWQFFEFCDLHIPV